MIDTSNDSKRYYAVYFALVVLTLLTCGLAFVPLHHWHAPIGLLIGALKAGLIAVFFMHILSSDRLPWMAMLAGILWFAILLGLTLTDYTTRATLSY